MPSSLALRMSMNLGRVSRMSHRNHLAMTSVEGERQWMLTTITQNTVFRHAISRLEKHT